MLCYRGNRLVPLIPRLLRLTYHDLRGGGERGRVSGRESTCVQAQRLRRGHDPSLSHSLTRSLPGTHALLFHSLPLSRSVSLAHAHTQMLSLECTHALTLSLSLPSGSSHYRCVSINSAAGGVRRETDRPNSAFLSIHLRPLFSAFFCFVGSLDRCLLVIWGR